MTYEPPPSQPYGGYPQPGYAPFSSPPTHGKATTSLVLGIISLVMCGFLTGIPAMILGRQAKREIRESNGQLGGDGLATAGFVTGLIGTIWTVFVTVLVIGVFAVGSTVHTEMHKTCEEFNSQGEFTTNC
jgi:hypothetical protein